MSVPEQRVSPIEPVVVEVETAPGSGRYAVDDRLRVERIILRSDDGISEAWISARLDDAFDALVARQRYHPDLRLIVRTDPADAATRAVLFAGYPTRQESIREGGGKSRAATHAIRATDVYTRLARDERAQIFGRRMRNGEIETGLLSNPGAYASRSVLVESLPCIFNTDGQPNRAAEMLSVVDAQGVARRIPVFSYDADPAAVSWSMADVLRYMLWFYHLPEGPVSVSEVLDATEAAVGVEPHGARAFAAPAMLLRRLLEPANDLGVEATNLAEALALLADEAGLHVTCVAEPSAESSRARLRLWAPEDGTARSAPLAWSGKHADGTPRYDIGPLTDRDILRDNVVRRVELAWDDSAFINAPIVVGDVRRWEATVELVPGWLPEVDLDNVAPLDREDKKLLALTPDQVAFLGPDAELVAWYRMYHRKGSEFADSMNVARLWVLNEDGAFDGARYNRNAPFDDYQPFDFASVLSAVSPGEWTHRPRPLSKTITTAADGGTFGVHVEVSFDGGSSWYPPVGSVTVLKDRAGIWFALANPTSMIIPGGDWYDTNLWYALIDQLFRVRVTAVFEDDARLTARPPRDAAHTPTLWRNSELLYQPRDFRFASRSDTVDVLASVNPGGADIEVDDSAAALAKAERVAAAGRGGEIRAALTIPWLDEVFTIGDRVRGLSGRSLSLNGVLRTDDGRDPDWSVIGKTYDLGGGKFETTLALARRVEPDGGSV